MNTVKSIGIGICILIVGFIIYSFAKGKIVFIDESDLVVKRNVYDSLVTIAERPPVIKIDTVIDTIYVYKTIYEVDTVEIVPTNNDSMMVAVDTLSTEYFKIFLTDSIDINNKTIFRRWPYESYPKTITKYIEKEKPVIIYKDKDISGFYYNINVGMFSGVGMFNTGVTYLTKQEFGIGAFMGVVYMNTKTEDIYKPIIGINFTKKF